MNDINKILSQYDFDRKTSKLDIDFDGIERSIGFKLPDDYKYYLEHYNESADCIGEVFVRLWEYDDLLAMNKGEGGYQVNDYLPNIIAIGSDGGGDFIGIELIDENTYRLILAPFIGMHESEYYIEIGTSFTDMLARLDNGQAWFD